MKFTNWQAYKLDQISKKRMQKALKLHGHPPIDDYKCEKYFGIENRTMHKPFSTVLDVTDDSVYVEVIFHASGLFFNSSFISNLCHL